MNIRIVTHTPDPEYWIEYCARVSSPKNQELMEKGELTPGKLIKFCADHGHWSIFELANVVMEIETTRAISAQILRHRSFSFQEFSTRYSKVNKSFLTLPEIRRAGAKNRQSSLEPMTDEETTNLVRDSLSSSWDTYEKLLEAGAAPETARAVLPLCTPTKLFMNGTVRSWIHYLQVRCKPDTQKEHREVALTVRAELAKILPICAEVFSWK